ncbi:hypothetical protein BMR03_03085 [Methylococcaceae bacterium HT2]|nr:hypothetical protein BMR03_03085 [Methylococcaceae bacterium HT2]
MAAELGNPEYKQSAFKRQEIAKLALSRSDIAINKMPANAEIYHTKAEIIQARRAMLPHEIPGLLSP